MRIVESSSSAEATDQLRGWLESHIDDTTLILASGGSAAKIFVDAFNGLNEQLRRQCTVSLADERYGEPGHENSNWKLLQACGLNMSAGTFSPVLNGAPTLEQAGSAWEAQLRAQLDAHKTVLVILGMGLDAHIAGIKPGSVSADETSHLVSAYEWEDYQRLTMTPVVFAELTAAALYIQGEAKQAVLRQIEQDLAVNESPVQLLKQVNDCTVYYQA